MAVTPNLGIANVSGDSSAATPQDDETAITKSKWLAEQRLLAAQVIVDDRSIGFELPLELPDFCSYAVRADPTWAPPPTSSPPQPPLKVVAGVDISFVPGTNIAVSSIAVFSFPSMALLGTHMRHCEMKLPYICTFLAFREVPALQELLDDLRAVKPELYPQLLLVDGNGYHHPRHCGVASHLGVLRDIPTIGVAKDFLAVGGLSKDAVEQALFASGEKLMQLSSSSCPIWGHVALTGNSTKNPIYISPGHRVSFATAVALTLMMCKVRIPEPIRQADLLSRAYIRQNFQSSSHRD